MFKITANPTFKADVRLTVPGQKETAVVEVEFRHKGRAELKAWLESTNGKTDAAALFEIIVDMPLSDEHGSEMAYSRERLEQLLNSYPSSAQEITVGYVLALTESRAKNSGGSLVA